MIAGIAVLVVAVAWLFSATLFSSKVLGGESNLLFQAGFDKPAGLAKPVNPYTFDALYVFHPDMLEARRQLRSFELPSWTANIGAGEPLLATQQNAALYPLNWPATLLPFWQSLEWLATLKLLAAGIGTLLLLTALGLRRAAALFGSVGYALCLYLVIWVEHPHVNSYALIPWALLFAYRLARDGRSRDAALLAATFGFSLLGGQPESTFLLGLITVPWFVASRPWLRALPRFALAGVVGLALGAITLLPFVELASHATQLARGGGDGEPRNWLLSFFMPELWGRPDKYELGGGPAGGFPVHTAYFGTLPLMLGFGGLLARRPTRSQAFFAVAALLSLGLVIRVPVYSHLVRNLPLFREVNMDRALVLCAMSGAVLAAYGVERLLEGGRAVRLRLLAGAALVALVPVAWLAGHRDLLHGFAGAWHQLPVMSATQTFRQDLQMGVVLRWCLIALAGLLLVAVVSWRPRTARAAALAIVALTVVDLVTLDRGYHPAIPYSYANPKPSATIRFLQANEGHTRLAGGSADVGPNVAETYELRDARQHAQPIIKRRALLWTGLGGIGLPQRTWVDQPNNRLTDLFGVAYLVNATYGAKAPAGWRAVGAPFTYERVRPAPRAWLAYDWKPAPNFGAALATVEQAPARDDRDRPVVEGVGAPPAATGRSGDATVIVDQDHDVRVQATAKRPAQLILADTFYPGWQAYVDGKRAPIHPANVAFRAVPVPAGNHTVEFVYRPLSVRIGLILSVLAALSIAAVLVSAAVRSRRWRGPGKGR